jgi:hypothetical protein
MNYFSDEELHINDASKEEKENMYWLKGTILNSVREKLGTITCTSGHRNSIHNKKARGSLNSHHLCQNGYAAADLLPHKCTLEILFEEIKNNYSYAELILEYDQGVVHVSKNTDPKLNVKRTSRRKILNGEKVYY